MKTTAILLGGLLSASIQIDAAQPLFAVGFTNATHSKSVLYRIDDYPNAPKASKIGDTSHLLNDIAFDPTSGRAYAVDASSPYALYELNPSTGVATTTNGNIAVYMTGLVFDRGGQLWGWGGSGGDLYKINKANGVAALVGHSGVSEAQGDLAFDTNGTLYATTVNNFLVTLNTNDGSLGPFFLLTNSLGQTVTSIRGLDIDTDGIMYAGRGEQCGNDYTGIAELYTVNKTNGLATLVDSIGHADGFSLAGLSFLGNNNPPTQPTNSIYVAVEVGWKSESNRLYQVQWRTNVNSGTWSNLDGWVLGNGSTNYIFDSTRGADRRFYRVQALQ